MSSVHFLTGFVFMCVSFSFLEMIAEHVLNPGLIPFGYVSDFFLTVFYSSL